MVSGQVICGVLNWCETGSLKRHRRQRWLDSCGTRYSLELRELCGSAIYGCVHCLQTASSQKRKSSPPHKISSHVGVFPLSSHWTNAPMSSTASTRITSTLYPQESFNPQEPFNPYPVEEEPEKALPVETPRREVYSERRFSSSLNFYRSISWILGFKDRYSLLNCFVWGGALVGFCLARSVTMNPSPGMIAAQLIPGT